jgi:hypothetical protein
MGCGWLLFGILMGLLLIFVLYYTWQFWRGRFIIHSHTNLGNLLLYYFSGMAKTWQRGENFTWEWINRTGKPTHPVIAQLPTSLPLNPKIQKQLQGLHINTIRAVDEWEYPTGWLQVMRPVVSETMTSALAKLGHNIQNREENPIVIHFRCSDTPFNRHPTYVLNRYPWYKQILERIPHNRQITLMACHTHLSCERNEKACSDYVQDFKSYLESLGYTVNVQCKSIAEDFATMLQASTLITAISSFSTLAALVRQGPSYLPVPHDRPMDRLVSEGLHYIPGGRLDHSQVKDYYDIETVCQQLRASNN